MKYQLHDNIPFLCFPPNPDNTVPRETTDLLVNSPFSARGIHSNPDNNGTRTVTNPDPLDLWREDDGGRLDGIPKITM